MDTHRENRPVSFRNCWELRLYCDLKEPACLLLIAAGPASPAQTGQLPDSIHSSPKCDYEASQTCRPLRNDTLQGFPFYFTGPFNLHGYKHMPIKIILEQQVQWSLSFKLIPPHPTKTNEFSFRTGEMHNLKPTNTQINKRKMQEVNLRELDIESTSKYGNNFTGKVNSVINCKIIYILTFWKEINIYMFK